MQRFPISILIVAGSEDPATISEEHSGMVTSESVVGWKKQQRIHLRPELIEAMKQN